MSRNHIKTAKNLSHTSKIAKDFLKEIKRGKTVKKTASVVGLSGDLGAGKTAFTQAMGKHLGIKRKMSSPTFVIIKRYKLKTPSKPHLNKEGVKFKTLFHLDAYRLKNEKELLHLGWQEIIENPEHLVFIEWPENVAKVMPKNSKFISISHSKDRKRVFKWS
jgi:tRNA threonylcarbamoyladenosine biosynthesis protein TsaE